jgi:hypothetical protein
MKAACETQQKYKVGKEDKPAEKEKGEKEKPAEGAKETTHDQAWEIKDIQKCWNAVVDAATTVSYIMNSDCPKQRLHIGNSNSI